MTYEETIRSLFAVLATCNAADSSDGQPWQKAWDASRQHGAYKHVRNAIFYLAGEDIIEHWAACGEIDIDLADRTHPQEVADHAAAAAFVTDEEFWTITDDEDGYAFSPGH